ncbi:MAG: hypothetical protein AAGA48_41175 [Myxococcota bacterium]
MTWWLVACMGWDADELVYDPANYGDDDRAAWTSFVARTRSCPTSEVRPGSIPSVRGLCLARPHGHPDHRRAPGGV